MFEVVHLDFETRSDVDLKKSGAERYAESTHTTVMCAAWAFDSEPIQGAHLAGWPVCPPDLAAHVDAGRTVAVHTAAFELNIWRMLRRRYPSDWPELRHEQMVDTMVMARALSLPAQLGQLAKAMKLEIEKDDEGRKLMLRLCKPKKPRKNQDPNAIIWQGTPAEFERQLDYCKRDVAVERRISEILPDILEREKRIWHIDRKINDRGVCLDTDAIPRLIAVADAEKERLNRELFELTGRRVKTANSAKVFGEWLQEQGAKVPDLKKATVAEWVARPFLAPNVRRALQIRQEASKSSTAKLQAMSAGVCADGRVRGLLEYHGASTGRWAGRRVQPQNMIRTPKGFGVDQAELVFALAAGEKPAADLNFLFENATSAVAWSMRSIIKAAEGSRLLQADYANIEGRALAWLSGEDWKIQAFQEFDGGKGADLYKLAFAKAFGIQPEDVTGDQRQIGKVMELALGYQGAHGAFVSMVGAYGIDLKEIATAVRLSVSDAVWDDAAWKYSAGAREEAEEVLADIRMRNAAAELSGNDDDIQDEPDIRSLTATVARTKRYGLDPDVWTAVRIIVDGWRTAHDATVRFWRGLEDAAIEAVQCPGMVTAAGRIRYRMVGDILHCRLPSGRGIAYPYAHVLKVKSDWSNRPQNKLQFEGVSSKTRHWQKQRAYGGLLAENVTQAVARDILADALLRLEGCRYNVVLHVHDEAVAEMPDGQGSFDEFCNIMRHKEPWADGLPIAVDGWEGRRYRK